MLRSSSGAVAVPEVMGLRRGNTPRVLALALVALVVAISVLVVGASPARAVSTFTVNQTGDQQDAELTDNVCDTNLNPLPRGLQCTLRAAIQQANHTANDSGGPDLINFAIRPADTVHTISLTSSPLPDITQPVTINGYSQPGASVNTATKGTNAVLLIELTGSQAGLNILTFNTTVRGLVINNSFGTAIENYGGGNTIEGNFLGTDVTGTDDRGNSGSGIFILGTGVGGTSGNVVGGTLPEDRNLISGNGGDGVQLSRLDFINTSDNTVQGNLIGTQKDGLSPLGNDSDGVSIIGADRALVGGTEASAANIIAFNGQDGVKVEDKPSTSENTHVAEANKIQRNSIFSNGGLGIDLLGPSEDSTTDVSTANDGGTANDSDTGPNGLQNRPNLTSATTNGTTITIAGRLDTKPNTTYTVQFFSQASGNEGKRFLGSRQVEVVQDPDGDGLYTFSFQLNQAVAAGQKITATATGPEGTSEFSAIREVTAS